MPFLSEHQVHNLTRPQLVAGARLILIHLQTEGMRSRTVNLGASFSAFMRSLGLAVTGGKRGTIGAVREQSLRISQCSFTMQWSADTSAGHQTVIANTRIVDRLELWSSDRRGWSETVELSERFHAHLREHAVPLDRRGIAHLSSNSLGPDLYALFAYRLPRLERDVHLRWPTLQQQIGAAEKTTFTLAQRVREVMPDVLTAYPHARIEVTPHGLLLKPLPAAVPEPSAEDDPRITARMDALARARKLHLAAFSLTSTKAPPADFTSATDPGRRPRAGRCRRRGMAGRALGAFARCR